MPYVLPCIQPFAIYVRGNLKSLLVFNKKASLVVAGAMSNRYVTIATFHKHSLHLL